MNKPFQSLTDREKIQQVCKLLKVPCWEPLDGNIRNPSLFIAGRRFMFTRRGQIRSITKVKEQAK